jgi:hypothetical protein
MNELSRDARRLIAEARPEEDLTALQRARLRRSIAMKVAGGVAVTTAASTVATSTAAAPIGTGAGAAGGGAVLGKLTIGVAVLAAVAGGGYALHTRNTPPPMPEIQFAPAPPASAALQQPTENANVPLPLPGPLPTASAHDEPPKAIGQHNKRVQTSEPSLQDQLERLRAAQLELRAGHGDRALALLDDHFAGPGTGALEEERRAARVLALCQLGRLDEAHAEAARFLKTSPSSPLAARVREACRTPE